MRSNSKKKLLSVILCIVLTALLAAGCTDSDIPEHPTDLTLAPASDTEATVLGEGATVFSFAVVDLEGKETWFEIHTDETIVGAALMAEGLITGEEGPYGLYVKAVNGVTADYEVDGTYWAFHIDGEYALTGVDETEITAGAAYSFVLTEG